MRIIPGFGRLPYQASVFGPHFTTLPRSPRFDARSAVLGQVSSPRATRNWVTLLSHFLQPTCSPKSYKCLGETELRLDRQNCGAKMYAHPYSPPSTIRSIEYTKTTLFVWVYGFQIVNFNSRRLTLSATWGALSRNRIHLTNSESPVW